VGLKPSSLIREMPPFFIALAAALLLITFVPVLSTWLPNVSGF
jgi:TRAP-type C4-dicarboxylate transport system permease large subunit